ncbi:MAG: hypothetical protein K6L76_11555 [Agarilytica sp.]
MMSTSKENEKSPFVLEQLEEALEERQKPDRRQTGPEDYVGVDRRKGDRRHDVSPPIQH